MENKDLTIRKLQTMLPWDLPYSAEFVNSRMGHKDFAHALTHAVKALGKLADLIEAEDHGESTLFPSRARSYIADLIICAARMANTFPHYAILDLEEVVIDRIETKNKVRWDGGKWEPIAEEE